MLDLNLIKTDKRNLWGICLFFVGWVMFLLMLFNPLNYSFIHIDEWYTLSLLQMSFVDGLKLTAADVHPPLYYLIVKIVIKLLTMLNISFDMIFVSKIVSLIPYGILLIVSGSKVKNNYGWLTAGIFVFVFGTMSEFFFKFITLRMYGWGLLFLLLSYIYLYDVMNKSDKKSWFLLTIFSVCGAYTHYFIAISSIFIYLSLFYYICFIKSYEFNLKIRKNELKKWFISVIGGLLLFSPCLRVVIKQLNTPGNYWIPAISLNDVINFISYFATNSSNNVLISIAILLLAILFLASFLKLKNEDIEMKYYLLIGIFSAVMTFLFLLAFSIFLHPILLPRYLIPMIGILWFVFAIIIGKIENKPLLIIILCLILLFGVSGAIETHNISGDLQDLQVHDKNLLNDMNTNDTVVIHTNGINVIMFNKYLNNTKQYSLSNIYGSQLHNSLNFKEKSFDDVEGIIDKNYQKKIYIIKNKGGKMPYLGNNRTAEKIDEICNSREVFVINFN